MKKSSSEHSYYDDHTGGGTSEFTPRTISRNVISASFFFKDDTHKEYGIYPGRSPYPLNTPILLDRARQLSIGMQDAITISSRIRATIGFSADHMRGMQAQSFNSTLTGLQPVICSREPANTSFSGCTARIWNSNPQGSITYAATQADTVFVTFADRGRFPLLKESYSYSLGKGLPNPDLKPEHSRNWDFGYARSFAGKTHLQVEVFRDSLRNAIELVYSKDPGSLCVNTGALAGWCSQNVNVGREVHSGAEITVRSTPFARLTVDANYSYLNRTLAYDFTSFPNVSQVNTSIQVLPSMPRNKLVGNAAVQLPRRVLAIVTARYEGGFTLQDTTYTVAAKPYGGAAGTMDVGAVVPIKTQFAVRAGIKNLFDRNYYYTAGFPEPGRNWYFNLRYEF